MGNTQLSGIFELRLTVGADDIDEFGHANNVAYVTWMQAAAIEHSTARGWPTERYVAIGSAWVAHSHHIEYLRPARLDDVVVVRTWVSEMAKASSVRRYDVALRDSEVVMARAETHWAYLDLATRRPVRIPDEVRNSFEVVDEPT